MIKRSESLRERIPHICSVVFYSVLCILYRTNDRVTGYHRRDGRKSHVQRTLRLLRIVDCIFNIASISAAAL